MAAKVRKQIYLRPEQEAALKRLGKASGLSEAEIIRQAVDNQLRLLRHSRPDQDAWERQKRFISERRKQGPSEGGRTWQREDLYDR